MFDDLSACARFVGRKRSFSGALLLVVMTVAGVFPPQSLARPTSAPTGREQSPRHRYRRPTLDDQVRSLATKLELTAGQQASLKDLLERRVVQSRQIWADQSISGADRVDRFRALNDNTVTQIRALLNDDQKKKYDPLVGGSARSSSPQASVEKWLEAASPKSKGTEPK